MPTIELQVPDGWQLPDVIKSFTPREWAIWLDAIAMCVNGFSERISALAKLQMAPTKEIDDLKLIIQQKNEAIKQADEMVKKKEQIIRQQIDTMNEQTNIAANKLMATVDDIRKSSLASSKQQIDSHATLILDLEKTYKSNFLAEMDQLHNYKSTVESNIRKEMEMTYRSQINMLQDSLANVSNQATERYKSLELMLTPVMKFYGGKNEEKGSIGENIVSGYIASNPFFSDSKLTDMSGTAHCGDILFEWRTLRCLIEVKNKKYVSKDDIAKFEADIRNMAEFKENKVNGALFVTFGDTCIQGKTHERVQFEIIHNIPTIYVISDGVRDIFLPLLVLQKIISLDILQKVNVTEKFVKHFTSYQRQTQEFLEYFTAQINRKHQEIKDCNKKICELRQNLDQINIDATHFVVETEKETTPQLTLENITTVYSNMLVQSGPPNKMIIAGYFGVTEADFDAFCKFSEVEQKCKDGFLMEFFTAEVKSKAVELKKTKGKALTRTELATFISDTMLRKARNVLGPNYLREINEKSTL